ncbi:MAG: hypothetical protein DHS20C14_13110 [Phycisphaeraceae bacterium]|nr:MAG: hypothetical protein DHS20C14_13110 [Phycisphaeraceae bacterium]
MPDEDQAQPETPQPSPESGGDVPTPEGQEPDVAEALEAAAQVAAETAETAGSAQASPGGDGAQAFALPDFEALAKPGSVHDIDLLSDVALTVRIELGRSRMLVEDVLRLDSGAVVELDKLAGDPVDVYVNNRHVARGEVLVLNDNFCVRINEILSGTEEERSNG